MKKYSLFQSMKKAIAPFLFLLGSSFLLASNSHAGECDLPPGVSVSGSNITGPMTVKISASQTAVINLYVKNMTYADGRCAAKVFKAAVPLWQSLYNDYRNRGMTEKNIKRLADSISGIPGAGVYIDQNLSACGYHGANRTIVCTSATHESQKGMMAHENMHGWQYQFETDQVGWIKLNNVFAHFANLVYTDYQKNPGSLRGTGWSVYNKPTNQRETNWVYGMQNEVEWGAEVFADWVRNTTGSSVWPYIKSRHPALVEYFDCVWKTDTNPSECARRVDAPIQIADNNPRQNPPNHVTSNVIVNGVSKSVTFTRAQSQAIWNVCFNNHSGSSSQSDMTIMNNLIKIAAPDLPGNPASAYRLGRVDANHDNVYDWVCTYEGPGPIGLGSGNYLWNKLNKNGAFSFIVSGKSGDTYAEYKQDPFLQLPTINGSLAQPRYREWQGQYNSAFGAVPFRRGNGDIWYDVFTRKINAAPNMLKPFTNKLLAVGKATWINSSSEAVTLGWVGLDGRIGIMGSLPAGATQTWGPAFFSGINFARDSQGNVVLLYAINGTTNQTLKISNAVLARARANPVKAIPYMASLPNAPMGQDVRVSNSANMALDLLWYDHNGLPVLIDTLAPNTSKTITSARFGSMFALTNRYGLVNPFVVTDAPNQTLVGSQSLVDFWKTQVGKQTSDTLCAKEGGVCSFTGTRFVSYGANGEFKSRVVQGAIACNRASFGDVLPGVSKACHVGASELSHCSAQNGRCAFTGSKLVAWGANQQFTWDVLKNGSACSNAVFGDPAPNTAKACYLIDFNPIGLAQGSLAR
jgi:hypothetical protein